MIVSIFFTLFKINFNNLFLKYVFIVSVTGNSVPQEMHSIHSHLKQLDSNWSSIRVELNRAFDIINNLTTEVKQIKLQMAKISDSVEAAPAIRQLPKELQELQKVSLSFIHSLNVLNYFNFYFNEQVVAEMGSRMTTNDNEVKSVKDKQNTQQLQTDSLQGELGLIRANISDLYAINEHTNNTTISAKNIESQLQMNNNRMNELTDKLNNLHVVYTNLVNWQTEADAKINASLTLSHHIHEKLHSQQESHNVEINTHIPNDSNSSESSSAF